MKVLVGGAPLNEAFAEDIGADRFCKDAAEAVVAAKAMMRMSGMSECRSQVEKANERSVPWVDSLDSLIR